jgi:hypothetical protein
VSGRVVTTPVTTRPFHVTPDATHTVVPAIQLIRKPDALPWQVAGALYVSCWCGTG